MSSSTIDEAVRLLELGYGDTERLKKIIETFNKTSMISMYDRKYIESLVTTYLVGTRRSPDKLPSENKNDLENARKPSKTIESTSTICDNCNSEIGKSFKFCPSCGKPVSEISEQVEKLQSEKTETEPVEEPFVIYGKATSVSDVESTPKTNMSREEKLKEYEKDYLQRQSQDSYSSPTYEQLEKPITTKSVKKGKKTNSKFIFIGIGVAVAIILGGGALLLSGDGDIGKYFDGTSSDSVKAMNVATCETTKQLVKTTKVDGFPDPEKNYQYYLDRYNNEPAYQDWFHETFPELTVYEAVC